jgi:hypothetical protein
MSMIEKWTLVYYHSGYRHRSSVGGVKKRGALSQEVASCAVATT